MTGRRRQSGCASVRKLQRALMTTVLDGVGEGSGKACWALMRGARADMFGFASRGKSAYSVGMKRDDICLYLSRSNRPRLEDPHQRPQHQGGAAPMATSRKTCRDPRAFPRSAEAGLRPYESVYLTISTAMDA